MRPRLPGRDPTLHLLPFHSRLGWLHFWMVFFFFSFIPGFKSIFYLWVFIWKVEVACSRFSGRQDKCRVQKKSL